MGVVIDIAKSYRRPKEVFGRRIACDDRTGFATLILGCFLMFVSRLPYAMRSSVEREIPFNAEVSAAMFITVFAMPLVIYLFAGGLGLLIRIFGLRFLGRSLRNSVIWAFLVTAPFGLLYGLVQGFIGPGVQTQAVGLVCFLVFVFFVSTGIKETIQQEQKIDV
ncbi:hypothetical protein Q4560_00380 [Celeribacter halophilus]|uniref:YIP1 family protein n=1 Tax=Celeribacter halophilus TaxID=576117 RepID=A0AAW7XP23_9RHOB|nr:hypothetical protein [Celeribacter halophilus]MDO6455506.1 hypothetical protein [Celeribacter halophilus]MDO6721710.1 hypothetical protein [Celeribacter halophilus]